MEHFNAFISYKHTPEDNVVAEAVHKGLERFHIPSKIQKKTGMKKISRIFRDKDELPITSDLSDTIASALTDSDYLIVICSTNTKKSAWVPREIEYFLKNHTRRQIFTVLVNGEPYDVIPEILLYEEKTVKDENGDEQTVKIPMEPLSCDYRMPLSKAKKTELPRLAAGIIGCSYDELMNRHRQYRMKQLIAVFSIAFAVMLGFSGYMLYSRNEIHKTYLESLKNQSQYLANESSGLLEKEQRIEALQLALEALPKNETDDRPVTAEAVKALTDATLAYEGNIGNNIHAVWNYQMPNTVTDFQISPEGKTIAAYDNGNVVAFWDTDTHERTLYRDNLQHKISGLRFLTENRLVVWTQNNMMCFDAKGNEIWEYKPSDSLLEDSQNFMINNDSILILNSDNCYLKLEKTTGNLLDTFPIPAKEGYEDLSIVESKISPDGMQIAIRGLAGWNSYAYGVYDLKTKKIELSPISEETVKDISWVGTDNLLVASSNVDMPVSMSFESLDIISSDLSTIKCVQPSDLSEKWTADFVCNGFMINSGFISLGESDIGYFSGNVITVYDLATGKMQYSNNVNDSLVDVSDVDGNGTPTYITENGGFAFPALSVDADAVYYTKHFAENLRQAKINSGVYVRSGRSSEVIHYASNVCDENWQPLSGDVLIAEIVDDFLLEDQCLAVLYDGEQNAMLAMYDPAGERSPVEIALEDDNANHYRLLGIFDNMLYFGHENDFKYQVITYDLTGKETGSEEMFEMAVSFGDSCVLKSGKLIYLCNNENYEKYLCCLDLATNQKSEVKVPDDMGYLKHAPIYYEYENVAVIQANGEYLFDLTKSSVKKMEMPEGWGEACCLSDRSEDSAFAISDGKMIIAMDREGKAINSINCPGIAPVGMTFIGNELFVIYQDGGLYRYAKNSGELIKKTEVTTAYSFHDDVMFEIDETSHLMYIRMKNLMDVVDLDTGVEIAHIMDCFGHQTQKDIFITAAEEQNQKMRIGYYKRYTVSELIDKAHEILQNTEISEEMKSRYGIE